MAKMRTMKCQLCEKEYPRTESKFTLCPECAIETTIREARILWSNLSIARTYELPATLTLRQWLATLDYFTWKCAYCQKQPHKIMEHFIPISMSDNYPRYYNAVVGGTTVKNCVPACYDCNGKKKNNCPDYIWEISSGVEQGMFPTLEMIERIAQYLQIDLNNLPMSRSTPASM